MKMRFGLTLVIVAAAFVFSASVAAQRPSLAGIQAQIDALSAVTLITQPVDPAEFPITIDQPGSYRLGGNLTVPNADTTAIEITADKVTLDLNGFAIMGPLECGFRGPGPGVFECIPAPGVGHGIFVDIPFSVGGSKIAISNGTVSGVGGAGIVVPAGSTAGLRVTNVDLTNNGRGGMVFVAGATSAISDSRISHNGNVGILGPGADLAVINSVIDSNGGDGIRLPRGGTVFGNVVVGNNGIGLNLGPEVGYESNTVRANRAGQVTGGVQIDGLHPAWSQVIPDSEARFHLVLCDPADPASCAGVLDNETGLVWERAPENAGGGTSWGLTVDNCFQGFGSGGIRKGWRTPRIEELASLIDRTQNPPVPADFPGVIITDVFYWSITTSVSGLPGDRAYALSFDTGATASLLKTDSALSLCVRGGNGAHP